MNIIKKVLSHYSPVILIAACMTTLVLIGNTVGTVSWQSNITEGLINVVAVVGLYVFSGNSGIISFSHTAFMAIGAYWVAWTTCCRLLKPIAMPGLPALLRLHTYPIIPSILIGMVLSAIVGLVIGLVIMRLSGLAASIATLAVLFIVNVAYSNWNSVTQGTASTVGLPSIVTPSVALICAISVVLVAYMFQRSRWGLMLRGGREDDIAAQACGVSLYIVRVTAYTLSGAIMGLAGALYAYFLGAISVNSFFLDMTFMTLAMLVVGGMSSLSGAVIGVAILQTVVDCFRALEGGISIGGFSISVPTGTQELVLAFVMLAVLLFRRNGVTNGREVRLNFEALRLSDRLEMLKRIGD